MQWEVEYTDQFRDWWKTLTAEQQGVVFTAVRFLRADGPSLGRPLVDKLQHSRHHNMKELRPGTSGNLRILFAFDPRRHAILLIGGDKTGRWKRWYDEYIPIADNLYDEYLNELRKEGLL